MAKTSPPNNKNGGFTNKRKRKNSSPRTKQKKPRTSSVLEREWAYSQRDFSNCPDRVVFVTYNILGVGNCLRHPDLYLEVKPKYLEWERRKKLICKEVIRYNPGVVCFQEVDRFDDLNKLLQKVGFRGIYQAQTGEAQGGCAIFWKSELFSLVHENNIQFKTRGLRDNVAQFCILEMIQNQFNVEIDAEQSEMHTSRSFLVGNIHVAFNPNRGDVKIGQVRLFLEKAHELSSAWGDIPIIIGGDFNSLPQSAIYQFIQTSKLNILHHERRRMCGGMFQQGYQSIVSCNYRGTWSHTSRQLVHRWTHEELMTATGIEIKTHLSHRLKLSSAYLGVHGSRLTRDENGEPLATSFHSKFRGTVDYIWHTKELVPVRVLETLPFHILTKTRGLPSKRWGSDHLALVCELAFVDDYRIR